jgi:hypothetical protein
MAEYLRKLYLQQNPITTKMGAIARVSDLFQQIEEIHGLDAAREIFENVSTPVAQNKFNQWKGWRLIAMYDQMAQPNVRALSREIERENAARSIEEQLTPRFRPSRETIESYLRELLRERRKSIQAGSWAGPRPGEWWPVLEPVSEEDL